MTEPTTRGPAMTKAEIESLVHGSVKELLAAAKKPGGAQISLGIQDAGFAKFKTWGMMTLGGVAVTFLGFGSLQFWLMKENVVTLNGQIATIIARQEVNDAAIRRELDDVKSSIRRLEDRP